MNKKEQISREKEINILKSVKLLLENDYYIKDIADILKKSTSTIQRYLNDPYIEYILGCDVKKEVEEKLLLKKQQGNLKGGMISTLKNEAIKNSNGKFIGVKER